MIKELFQTIITFAKKIFFIKKSIPKNKQQPLLKKVRSLELHVAELNKNIVHLTEMNKINHEMLVYLCTINEELLNTIYEGKLAIFGEATNEDIELTEDDFLNSQWNNDNKKTNNNGGGLN